MGYNNFLFDLYGTLVDIWTDETTEDFWNKISSFYTSQGASYTAKTLKEKYQLFAKEESAKIKKQFPEYKHIDIDLTKVFYKLYEIKNIDASSILIKETAKYFRQASTVHLSLYEGVLDLLNKLKNQNKKIFLLSNAQRCFTINELKELGIINYFDDMIISSDINCSKPDSHFFNLVIDKHSLDKNETIMIGNDCFSDIEGSFNCGIDSLYIHQKISPSIENVSLKSKYKILDGDVNQISSLLL